jgi:hypothetical protein
MKREKKRYKRRPDQTRRRQEPDLKEARKAAKQKR